MEGKVPRNVLINTQGYDPPYYYFTAIQQIKTAFWRPNFYVANVVEFMVRCMVFYLFLKYPTLSGPKNRRRAGAWSRHLDSAGPVSASGSDSAGPAPALSSPGRPAESDGASQAAGGSLEPPRWE